MRLDIKKENLKRCGRMVQTLRIVMTWTLIVMPVVFGTGCVDHRTEQPEQPKPPNTDLPDLIDKIENLYNERESAMYPGDAYGAYLIELQSFDPVRFNKLVALSKFSDQTFIKQFGLETIKIPEFISCPNPITTMTGEDMKFENELYDFLITYEDEFRNVEPSTKVGHIPTPTARQIELSDMYKERVTTALYQGIGAVAMPFGPDHIRAKNANRYYHLGPYVVSFSGPNSSHIVTHTIDLIPVRCPECCMHELFHDLGGNEPIATFSCSYFFGFGPRLVLEAPSDFIIGTISNWECSAGFLWNFVKKGMPVQQIFATNLTSNKAVDKACDPYLKLNDGTMLCSMRDIRTACGVCLEVKNNSDFLQKFAHLGLNTEDKWKLFSCAADLFNFCMDPNTKYDPGYNLYGNAASYSHEQNIQRWREFIKICKEYAKEKRIPIMDYVLEERVKTQSITDYDKTAKHIDDLYQKAVEAGLKDNLSTKKGTKQITPSAEITQAKPLIINN